MSILLWTVSLLLGAVLLAALARRIKVPSPSLFALGGVLIALLPHAPRISLEPDLALALFVAPVLMDAAFDNSLRDLRQYWIPVVSLVFVAVAVTTAAVAIVARWLVPAMPWAAAIALGAAVAPPDAAAATAVLREVRMPRRLVTILEDESLLNDASALLIYRLAVGAAVAAHRQRNHHHLNPGFCPYRQRRAGNLVRVRIRDHRPSFFGRIQLDRSAIHRRVRNMDRGGSAGVVGRTHDRNRRGGIVAPLVDPDARRSPASLLRRVEFGGLRPQRARVHPGRAAARPDHGPSRPRASRSLHCFRDRDPFDRYSRTHCLAADLQSLDAADVPRHRTIPSANAEGAAVQEQYRSCRGAECAVS